MTTPKTSVLTQPSLEANSEETRWSEQQQTDKPCVSFVWDNGTVFDIPLYLLDNTIIGDCKEDCGEAPTMINVPSTVPIPLEPDDIIASLVYMKRNCQGSERSTVIDSVTSKRFLDFIGVYSEHVPWTGGDRHPIIYSDHRSKYLPPRQESDRYLLGGDRDSKMIDVYDYHPGHNIYPDEDEFWCSELDMPRRSTKTRILQKRQRQANYDPCGEDYDDYDEDEMYSEWIESLNIEEQDFTL
jgi:hypothetical protein